MKKRFFWGALFLLASVSFGCSYPRRTITLYDGRGKVIKSWETSGMIQAPSGNAWFRDDKGRAVDIHGVIVIEEKQ